MHKRSAETLQVTVKPIILVEGILLLHYPEVRDLLDIKVRECALGSLRGKPKIGV